MLPSTPGSDKQRILAALDGLEAGGSTAGGAGIRLAYDVARQNFVRGGNNRVILCTDGDFNVGASSDGELVELIEQRRTEGAFLTVLGFGMGNYKDAKMEKLADDGNGNYAYIDDLLEARKMLVKEMGGTLVTVAKDVKLQVEFNPARVRAYRLLGYEDRLLRDEDFANDAKDAGEIGAGHTVTALYEIVRTDVPLDVHAAGDGRAALSAAAAAASAPRDELLHVAMRYKEPDGERSRLVTHPVRRARAARPRNRCASRARSPASACCCASSPHAGSLTWPQVVELARGARGDDRDGYRADFIRLAELASRDLEAARRGAGAQSRLIALDRRCGDRHDSAWPTTRTFSIETTADGVRTLTLDRADKLNAVNGALAASLSSAVADAAAEDAVRVVVITGAGRAFCAGLDLSEPPTLPTATRVDRLDPYAWVGTWVRTIVELREAGHRRGERAGGRRGVRARARVRRADRRGVGAHDRRLRAARAQPGRRRELACCRVTSGSRARADILLTGRDVDAGEAERIGLAAHVVADAEFADACASTRRGSRRAHRSRRRSRSGCSCAASTRRSTPRCATSSCTSSSASPRATSPKRSRRSARSDAPTFRGE